MFCDGVHLHVTCRVIFCAHHVYSVQALGYLRHAPAQMVVRAQPRQKNGLPSTEMPLLCKYMVSIGTIYVWIVEGIYCRL